DIVAAAREVRDRLTDLKLKSFVKTSGGKGLHVVLPIKPTPWDEAKDFCRRIAEQMEADAPNRYTSTVKKVARGNRIFIDYLRNTRRGSRGAPLPAGGGRRAAGAVAIRRGGVKNEKRDKPVYGADPAAPAAQTAFRPGKGHRKAKTAVAGPQTPA